MRGLVPRWGWGWGVAESAVPIRCTKPQLRLFTPRRAGTSRHQRFVRKHDPGLRHESSRPPRHAGVRCNPLALVMPAPQSSFPRRAGIPVPNRHSAKAGIQRGGGEARPPPVLVRKHVPDYDPGCALQSTSMPALRRRNLPNCRPMADGGMRKCSAGACPPLGLGVGRGRIRRANSLYQTTTPAFHTSVCRHQPARAIGTKARPGLRSGMNRSRHDRRSRHAGVRWNPSHSSCRPPQSSFRRRACPVIRGRNPEGRWEARPPPVLVRKHVPD